MSLKGSPRSQCEDPNAPCCNNSAEDMVWRTLESCSSSEQSDLVDVGFSEATTEAHTKVDKISEGSDPEGRMSTNNRRSSNDLREKSSYYDVDSSDGEDDDYFDRESSFVSAHVIAGCPSDNSESEEQFHFDQSLIPKFEGKIRNLISELIDTERKYVADLHVLCKLFDHMKYSILEASEAFMNSADTVAVDVATHQIYSINSLFLEKLISGCDLDAAARDLQSLLSRGSFAVLPAAGQAAGRSELLDSFTMMIYVLESWKLFTPLFTCYGNFMARHGGTINLFEKLRESDNSFNAYSGDLTFIFKETFGSLLIKPVQRLPRYVMLSAELRTCVDHLVSAIKAVKSHQEVSISLMGQVEALSTEVNSGLVTCTRTCNDLIRIYQDNISLHKMYRSVKQGDVNLSDFSADSLVSPHRQLLKEGFLRRHHKHSGIRTHVFHLFSDLLLCSNATGSLSPSGASRAAEEAGKSNAALEFKGGSNVMCLSIPSFQSSDPNIWFLLAGKKKSLYISAENAIDKAKWMEAIQSCIERNKCDVELDDLLYVSRQVALVNSMLYLLEQQELKKTQVVKAIEKLNISFEYAGRGASEDVWVELTDSVASASRSGDAFESFESYSEEVADAPEKGADVPGAVNDTDQLKYTHQHSSSSFTSTQSTADTLKPSESADTENCPLKPLVLKRHRRSSTGAMPCRKPGGRLVTSSDKTLVKEKSDDPSKIVQVVTNSKLDIGIDPSLTAKPAKPHGASEHSRRASTGSVTVQQAMTNVEAKVDVKRLSISDRVQMRILTAMNIQVSWWQLLDIVTEDSDALFWRNSSSEEDEELGDERAAGSMVAQGVALRQVAEENSRCIIHNVIAMFAADDALRSRDVVSKLLIDGNNHWIISSGCFFESTKLIDRQQSDDSLPDDSSSISVKRFMRPRILRLFLFHDIIVVGSCLDLSKSDLSLHFYCDIKNLLVEDYRQGGVSDCAIILSNDEKKSKFVDGIPLIRSIARSMSERRSKDRIVLFAPSRALKFEWIMLLIEISRVHNLAKRRSYRSINPDAIDKIAASVYKPTWFSTSL